MQLPLMLIFNIGSAFLGMLRQFVIMNILSPITFGIYNFYSVWINFGNYLDFGTNNGVLYKSLEQIKMNDFNGAINTRQIIFKFTFILGCIYFLIALTMIIFFKLSYFSVAHERYIIALIFFAPLLLIHNMLIVECRIQEKFVLYGSAVFIGAMVALALIIVFAYGLDVDSVEVYVILSQFAVLISIISMMLNRDIRRSLVDIDVKIQFSIIKKIIIEGVPLTIQPILFVCHQSMDRILYINLMHQANFGFYALGSALGSYLSIISSTVATRYATKHISVKFDSMRLEDYLRPVIVTSIVVGLLCLGFNLIGERLLLNLLPKYVDGFNLIYLTMCAYGSLFPVLIIMPILMANNYKIIIIIQQLIIIITFCIATKFLQDIDVGSEVLAIMTLSFNLIFSLVMLNNAMTLFKAKRIQKFLTTMKIFMPYIALAIIIPYMNLNDNPPFLQRPQK